MKRAIVLVAVLTGFVLCTSLATNAILSCTESTIMMHALNKLNLVGSGLSSVHPPWVKIVKQPTSCSGDLRNNQDVTFASGAATAVTYVSPTAAYVLATVSNSTVGDILTVCYGNSSTGTYADLAQGLDSLRVVEYNCPAGQHGGWHDCHPCPEGTFSVGNGDCQKCPTGTYSSVPGSISAANCSSWTVCDIATEEESVEGKHDHDRECEPANRVWVYVISAAMLVLFGCMFHRTNEEAEIVQRNGAVIQPATKKGEEDEEKLLETLEKKVVGIEKNEVLLEK